MAKWILLNTVTVGSSGGGGIGASVKYAGETLDDTVQSLAPIQAVGGVFLPVSDATIAAAAAIAIKYKKKAQVIYSDFIGTMMLAQALKTFSVSPAIATFQKVAADGAAATATAETPIASIQNAGLVQLVQFIPNAALTADPANNATILVQKRTAGGAPVTVAQVTTNAAGTGNWVQWVPVTIPITATNTVAAGDALTWSITKAGTGVVVPAGQLEVFPG